MGTLSANTLFHFTSKKDTLINILKTKLYPRLSLEEMVFANDPVKMAYPMVCFCDIPLSQISDHANNYGMYAIGLKKDWAIKNGITPVFYTHKSSHMSKNLWDNFKRIRGEEPFKYDFDLYRTLLYTSLFIKPYKGTQERNGKKKRVVFYNEREWRYIPPKKSLFEETGTPPVVTVFREDIFKEPLISSVNKICEKYGLGFTPKDINYIIVDKESEILEVKDSVEQIKGNYSYNDVRLLSTRIISMERIREDS